MITRAALGRCAAVRILAALAAADQPTAARVLARAADTTHAWTQRILAAAGRHGLATRVTPPDPTTGRPGLWAITPAGAALARQTERTAR
jgi:hypothetical protein